MTLINRAMLLGGYQFSPPLDSCGRDGGSKSNFSGGPIGNVRLALSRCLREGNI